MADSGPETYPKQAITGVILAGGRARRMGGRDKGLLELNGQPMTLHVANALAPQVGRVLVNANRNREDYLRLGFPVISDRVGDYFGPLAGMASAMEATDSDYILSTPCDSPILPGDMAMRLYRALNQNQARISVAHDGVRMQPVFALIQVSLLPDLMGFLDAGDRKIDLWYARHATAEADFSDRPETFHNVNTPEDLERLEGELAARTGAPS